MIRSLKKCQKLKKFNKIFYKLIIWSDHSKNVLLFKNFLETKYSCSTTHFFPPTFSIIIDPLEPTQTNGVDGLLAGGHTTIHTRDGTSPAGQCSPGLMTDGCWSVVSTPEVQLPNFQCTPPKETASQQKDKVRKQQRQTFEF